LVVDDDSFGRELLKCFLTEYADLVDTAQDGAEALRLFNQSLQDGRPYQFICLDILMPVMNGQEALKQMRDLERDVGVDKNQEAIIIMTTALSSLEEIQKAIWQGDCNNYLVKPISQGDLLALLNKYNLIP
jgi:two-component system chemotaxis response regulator CheY